jgi:hypothetical protein
MKKFNIIFENKWSQILLDSIVTLVLIWYALNHIFYRQDPLAVFVVQSRLILDGIAINYIDQPGIWVNYLSIPVIYFYQIFNGSSDGFPGNYEANQWLYLFNIFVLLIGFLRVSKKMATNGLAKIIAALVVMNPLALCVMGSADGYAYAFSILAVSFFKLEGSSWKNKGPILLLALAATSKSIYLIVFFVPIMINFNCNDNFLRCGKELLKSTFLYIGLLGLIILLLHFPITDHISFLRNPKIANFESAKLLESVKFTFQGLAYYPEIYLPFLFALYLTLRNIKLINSKLAITILTIFILSILMIFMVSARPYKAHTYLLIMIPIYLAYIRLLNFNSCQGTFSFFSDLIIQISLIVGIAYFQIFQYELLQNERNIEEAKFQKLSAIIKPYSNLAEFEASEIGGKNYLDFKSSYQLADDYSRNLYSKELALEAFSYFKGSHNFFK